MGDLMTDFVISFLTSYPFVIWVYLGAMLLAVGLRATWDVSEERPRIVRFILAIVDFMQLNFSGPVKLVSNQIKGKTP